MGYLTRSFSPDWVTSHGRYMGSLPINDLPSFSENCMDLTLAGSVRVLISCLIGHGRFVVMFVRYKIGRRAVKYRSHERRQFADCVNTLKRQ